MSNQEKTKDNHQIKIRAKNIFVLHASIMMSISVKNNGEIGIPTSNIKLMMSKNEVIFNRLKRLFIFSNNHDFILIKIFPADINDAVLRKLCQIIWRIHSFNPIGPSHKAKTIIHIFSLLE